MKKSLLSILVTLSLAAATSANAAIIVSEVAPWSSGNSSLGKDWFELTNTGSAAVTITGWKVDDGSASFASALVLNGVTSINAGESVIFIESSTSASTAFNNLWFGANVPANLQIGYYSGSAIGLSTSGDAVNIYNSSGVLQASVSFGASDAVSPFHTFDNAAGVTGAISTLSQVGVNGAFVATNSLTANSITEIGSPGRIAAVPEPETFALLVAGLGLVGFSSRKRQA
ncbi:MAG: lamin tail domain-containing protein [Methylophilus sp.]|nr:lamin tail domain-containing protein [Methylophilus sp.]